ncbi:DNA-3-methyladenine glycosylase family protein [Pseudomonas fontis]|uniref:DNA-3-methyladenine glycosylase II n=1 Tax=Pseudomonas fontis TaxID=2942633 RepID=A0ABT5P0J2_9PSED|nr:DNA-3-methyladenine glycosylase [Pseudomonas fontis]MDD0972815.1 DNA-3-methyladenine glycosylase [Pseudomonas fontis]MDD0993973.1 DNA-3-methyladenine glycosylase [Pseudomonas fontis]
MSGVSPLTPFYTQATAHLSNLDATWAAHIQRIGPCLHAPLPTRDPYQALVRSIAYQQLHAKAAEAILGRFLALYPGSDFPSPQQLLATAPEQLRACGFSATKLNTLQGIAQARLDGIVPDHEQARLLDQETLITQLTTLRGVGRWTVEMLLIYTLEHMDILPADDFGVREGYRRLYGLERQPTRKQMIELGLAWSPYRTLAAWYLWRA